MHPHHIWGAHVDVADGVVFSAIIKEDGVVVSKIFVANISNLDPGICGTESRCVYGVVWVRGVEGGVPYIIE